MPLPACKKEVLGKYLPLSTLANSESGLERILHPYMANNAIFKTYKSRKSNPPWVFGAQNMFQLTQCTRCLLYCWSHQKLDSKLLILQQRERNFEAWHSIGRDSFDEGLFTPPLPPLDRSNSFHLVVLLIIWSLIIANIWLLAIGMDEGRLRNLSCSFILLIWRIAEIYCLTALEVFLLKTIADFSKLISCPLT